ncbi:MAG TPA: M20/M25/M40 family metallo-hydrolase, partial [Acidimicrobiales bacterium]|nr:M20/M25/M40 family metallo-hydrolase [Acidimicrobiales bacterium]
MSELTGEATELLTTLIRNACVNDGTPESGQETRTAAVLQTYLEGAGLDVERFESLPGRTSIVARIEGTDPEAPTLCLMGHTDVVPVNPAGWSEEPFGGDVIDGEVWGRGAIDMLNITATMAVAVQHLARSNFRPKGTLVYFGVADEEAGGPLGAGWMADHHWDTIACDYLLTEIGGWSVPTSDGSRRIAISVGEKGLAWRRLRISGTPAHGSMPYGADNALITAAEVVRRLAAYRPAPYLDDLWRGQVEAMDVPADVKADLLDPGRLDGALGSLPPALARRCHATTHTTFSPNVVHGGQKTNMIPDEIVLEVDIRTVPGETAGDV